jgi:hypothetical protein
MPPAQEGLEPGDGSILKAHDRPEEHADLAALQGVAHVPLERQSVGTEGAQDWRKNLDAVAPSLFGAGERELSVDEEISAFDVQCGIVVRGADGYGERDFALAKADRRGERRPQRVDPARGVGRLGLSEDDGAELIAGEARQRVARRQVPRQSPGHREQGRVSNG